MIGQELFSRRHSLGLSQAELAAKLDIPVNTIARWERGELPIRHGEMLKWALIALENEESNMSNEERYQRNLKRCERMEADIADDKRPAS